MSASSDNDKMSSPPGDDLWGATRAYQTFTESDLRDRQIESVALSFLAFVPDLRDSLPSIKESAAAKALDHLLNTYDKLTTLKVYGSGARLLSEFMLSRAVDNFQCYLADILLAVFVVRPETLRSSDRIKVDEVLECASIDEVVSRLAQRKTEELMYNSASDIVEFMSDRLGLGIKADEQSIVQAIEAIAVRNAIVHNRGLANERFLRLTKRTDLKSGDLIPINYTNADQWRGALRSAAKLIDRLISTKFGKGIVFYPQKPKS
jgi:hypothetical protein